MSQNRSDVIIEEVRRDRCTRLAKSTIRGKILLTPNFCTQIKTLSEFDIYHQLRLTYRTDNLGSVTLPYFVAERTIAPLVRRLTNQNDLNGNVASSEFLKNTVIGIDPYVEGMSYSWWFDDLLNSNLTPTLVKQFAQEVRSSEKKATTVKKMEEFKAWKPVYHRKFWIASMLEDPSRMAKLVSDYLDVEQRCGADYFIPPCPPIDDIEEMLLAAFTVNEKAKAIKPIDSVATYFLLTPKALNETNIITKIIDYITENRSKITGFKIKNFDLLPNNYTAFTNYVGLLREIDLIKRSDPERLFFIWESGYQAYPSLVAAFDSVSTSVRGLDKDGAFGRPSEHGFSHWYHPKLKVHLTHHETIHLSELNANTIMDNCPACLEIETEPARIIKDNWNPYTKRHYLLTWNAFIQQIRSFVESLSINLARDEVMEEAVNLRKFKDFIPTY